MSHTQNDLTLCPMNKIGPDTLEALRDGNHKAFDDVFIGYYKKIKNFIYGFLKSESDAEELTQDIFVKLWINRTAINPERSFDSFLYTTARNATLNYLKHKVIENSYAESLPLDEEEYASSDEILFAKEISLLIEMSVERMPAQRKKIYCLSRNEGLSNDEIATHLNISKKTVENQLSMALKELRNVISCFLLLFL